MPLHQRTVHGEIGCTGIGLHTGKKSQCPSSHCRPTVAFASVEVISWAPPTYELVSKT